MSSQKLTRITLKMTDFEEFEQVKRERERAMDTSQTQTDPAASQTTEVWSVTASQRGSAGEERGGIPRRLPVRASTPDTP